MAGLSPKEIRTLLDHLRDQGVTMKRTKNGWLLYLPNGETAIIHLTLSDWRGHMPLRAQIKKAGLTWPTDSQLKSAPKFDGVDLPDYITKGKPTPATLEAVGKALETLDKQGVKQFYPKQVLDIMGKSNDYSTVYRAFIHLNCRPVPSKTGLTKKWERIPEEPVVAEVEPVVAPDEQPGEYPELQTARGVAAKPPVPTTEGRIVLDSEDSWTIELRSTAVGDLTVRQLRQVLQATGMSMEIRVWRDPRILEQLAASAVNNATGVPELEKIKNGDGAPQ